LPRDETMGAGHRRISGGDATPDDPLQHQPGALASPTFAWRTAMEMPTAAEVTRFRPMLDFIANNEGTAGQPGDGYNTSLGFGRFIGGEKILVAMTLQQIDALQTEMLANPNNNFNSSALGRYQIVRRTLRGMKEQLNLAETALFDKNLQDRFGVVLISGRGRDVDGLRQEWASLQNVDPADILAAFDTIGT